MEFTVLDAVDIFIVAYVIYKLMNVIRGTRATTLIKGLAVVFVASLVAQALALQTVSWLLEQSTTVIFVALPIVFYPELRRALEQIGRGQFFAKFGSSSKDQVQTVIDVVVKVAVTLSARRVGVLIAIERETGLQEFVETGILLDALISTELLANVFEPNSPLHDGAVIIRSERIMGAACFLPLTESSLDSQLGTRHRAAVGLSEQTDALIIVVSEETGAISLAVGGQLRRYLTESRLTEQLQAYLHRSDEPFRFRRG